MSSALQGNFSRVEFRISVAMAKKPLKATSLCKLLLSMRFVLHCDERSRLRFSLIDSAKERALSRRQVFAIHCVPLSRIPNFSTSHTFLPQHIPANNRLGDEDSIFTSALRDLPLGHELAEESLSLRDESTTGFLGQLFGDGLAWFKLVAMKFWNEGIGSQLVFNDGR